MTATAVVDPELDPAAWIAHPSLTGDDRQWRTNAECAQPHPEANWFPDQHHAGDVSTKNALDICRNQCPVRMQCLRYALVNDRHKDGGILGGMTAKQRQKLRARLVAEGKMRTVRICANPACRAEFAATPTTMRTNVCCSDACRLQRRRILSGRWR